MHLYAASRSSSASVEGVPETCSLAARL